MARRGRSSRTSRRSRRRLPRSSTVPGRGRRRRTETLIAGCYEKAEDVDDSDGSFGSFVASLFSGWTRARGAAGADPQDTACRLLAWMDAGFEEVVAGGGPSAKPSFLGRTKARGARAPGGGPAEADGGGPDQGRHQGGAR